MVWSPCTHSRPLAPRPTFLCCVVRCCVPAAEVLIPKAEGVSRVVREPAGDGCPCGGVQRPWSVHAGAF
jgi:hypothetical protein